MNDIHDGSEDERLRTQLRGQFDKAVAELDPATGNRLRLMRRETLSASRSKVAAWRLPLAAAAAAVLALGLAWQTGQVVPAQVPTSNPDDEALATGFPSEEDAELYAWLGEAPVAPAQDKTL